MARTTAAKVQGILGKNYDTQNSPDLVQFIEISSPIVDRVASCSTAKGKPLTGPELELMERWLAAHFYAQMDQLYSQKTVDKASGTFQGQTGMSFESTRYGQSAINIDYSGCLIAIGKRQVATAFWAGKPQSEQIPLCERS